MQIFVHQICITLDAVLHKLHEYGSFSYAKLIWVNFDAIQEFKPKVESGHSFNQGVGIL